MKLKTTPKEIAFIIFLFAYAICSLLLVFSNPPDDLKAERKAIEVMKQCIKDKKDINCK